MTDMQQSIVVRAVCAIAVVLLTACGAGATGTTTSGSGLLPQPAASAAPNSELVFVAGPAQRTFGCAQNSVNGFGLNDSGNVRPSVLMCDFGGPFGLLLGPDGTLYVAGSDNTVKVFAPSAIAGGNAVPTRTISCGGLAEPKRMALDAAGNLYVVNWGASRESISVFAPNASGCVTGNRMIQGPHTFLGSPMGIAIYGDTIFVTRLDPGDCGPPAILEYPVTASGDAMPSAEISGPLTQISGPWGIGFDDAGNMYVANTPDAYHSSILVFAPGSSGDTAPMRVITGPNTQMNSDEDISVRGDGTVYVANYFGNSVTVYAPNANGDAAPAQVIAGSNTLLRFPQAIAVPKK